MRRTGKRWLIILAILGIAVVNISNSQTKRDAWKEIITSNQIELQNMGIRLSTPRDFPPPLLEGSKEEGKVSFNQLLEQTRYNQYFVIVWSEKYLPWKKLLPKPRVSFKGVSEKYNFRLLKEGEIIIDGRPAEYRKFEFIITRTCGTEHKNFLLVCKFDSPQQAKHYIALFFSETNKEKEFCNTLKSLRLIDAKDY